MTSVAEKLHVDPRRQARFLYWMGWRVGDIASLIGEKEKTVHRWRARDEWGRAETVERLGGALGARLAILIHKEGKNREALSQLALDYTTRTRATSST